MDEDAAELVAALCTRIGMIMEDTSVIALTISPLRGGRRHEALSDIEAASERIGALISAVRTLHG